MADSHNDRHQQDQQDQDDQEMEEVEIKVDHPDWFNFEIEKFYFRPDPSFTREGFEFDDTFLLKDPLCNDSTPAILNEIELVRSLRRGEKCAIIPEEAYEFYAKIKEHTFDEFIALATGLVKNSEQIQKLDFKNSSNTLLKYFELKMSGSPNFGRHPLLQKAALEHEKQMKKDLRDISLQLQKETQIARERANDVMIDKLKCCQKDFSDYGKAFWIELCGKTSKRNILDQRFIVRLSPARAQESSDDSEDDYEAEADENADEVRKSGRDKFCPLSTFLYILATHDSEKKVEENILQRRMDITNARAKATALRDKQELVSIHADNAKLPDVQKSIGRKFVEMEADIAHLKSWTQAPPASNAAPSQNGSKVNEPSEEGTSLASRVEQLTSIVLKLQATASNSNASSSTPAATSSTLTSTTSKNGTGADKALSKSARQHSESKRRKREMLEDTEADTEEEATNKAMQLTASTLPTTPSRKHVSWKQKTHQRKLHPATTSVKGHGKDAEHGRKSTPSAWKMDPSHHRSKGRRRNRPDPDAE
jgi:hypothetical protein